MSELALVDQSSTVDISRWSETLVFASRLADAVSGTDFVPGALRDKPEAVTACVLYGAEIGVTPMQALQGIHIVDGRPAPSAELMRALILRAGHTLTVHEMTGTRARVSGLRAGRPESERVTVEWTLDMARAAGLLGRQNWQRYPRAMLVARATSDLARLVFPDAVKGLGYIAEDADTATAVESWGPPEPWNAPELEVAPKRLQRKPRKRATDSPPVAPPPDAAEEGDPPPSTPGRGKRVPSRSGGPRTVENVPLPGDEDEPDEAPRYKTWGGDQPLPPDAPPMPDLEPEAPADEGPQLIGTGLWRAMQAGLREQLGEVATDEERHALAGAILGREVTSTKDLTRDEAARVMVALARFEDGSLGWEFTLDPAGPLIRVHDLRPEQ